MEFARDILPSVYRQDGDCEDRDFDLILSYWPAAAGRRVAVHARPVFYRRGRLTIEVDEPQWLLQLEAIVVRLRRRLNEELGLKLVDYILFRTAGPGRFGPGRAVESDPAPDREIRNPMRRRLYGDSKKASGE